MKQKKVPISLLNSSNGQKYKVRPSSDIDLYRLLNGLITAKTSGGCFYEKNRNI